MHGSTTSGSESPILFWWPQWATVFLNLLSVSHLKPNLRYVGDINGLQASQKAVRAMTYLNPRSAPLNDDITIGIVALGILPRLNTYTSLLSQRSYFRLTTRPQLPFSDNYPYVDWTHTIQRLALLWRVTPPDFWSGRCVQRGTVTPFLSIFAYPY